MPRERVRPSPGPSTYLPSTEIGASDKIVLKGGSFSSRVVSDAKVRGRLPFLPDQRLRDAGFRCARDLELGSEADP